jgi:hypothetical protein
MKQKIATKMYRILSDEKYEREIIARIDAHR